MESVLGSVISPHYAPRAPRGKRRKKWQEEGFSCSTLTRAAKPLVKHISFSLIFGHYSRIFGVNGKDLDVW